MFIPLLILLLIPLLIPLFILLLIPLFTQPPVTVRRWRTLTSPLGGTARWAALGGEGEGGKPSYPSFLPYPPYYYITYYFLTIDNTPFLYTYK